MIDEAARWQRVSAFREKKAQQHAEKNVSHAPTGTIVLEPVSVSIEESSFVLGEATYLSHEGVRVTLPLSARPICGDLARIRFDDCFLERGKAFCVDAELKEVVQTSHQQWECVLSFENLSAVQKSFLTEYVQTVENVIGLFQSRREVGSAPLTVSDLKNDITQLGLDSLAAIDIVANLERCFHLIIDDREIIRFRSIQSVLQHLRALMHGGEAEVSAHARTRESFVEEQKQTERLTPDVVLEQKVPWRVSAASHPLLVSHRLGGHPILPFVDFVNDVLMCASVQRGDNRGAVVLEKLNVENPIVVRDGNERSFSVLTRQKENRTDLEWSDASHTYARACVLFKNESSCFQRHTLGQNEINLIMGSELYSAILPHGRQLQCVFHWKSLSSGHFECRIEAQGDLGFSKECALNPAVFDGVLQACALYTLMFGGETILPRQVEQLEWAPGRSEKCSVVWLKAVRLGNHQFQILALDETGDVVFRAQKLAFSAVNERHLARQNAFNEILNKKGFGPDVISGLTRKFRDGDLLQMHKEPSVRVNSKEIRLHSFFEKHSEKDIFEKVNAFYGYLVDAKENGSYMYRRTMTGPSSARVALFDTATQCEREMIMMASNNYLDLANHPDIIEASVLALRQYGYGAGSVPLLAGTLDVHRKLERVVAETYEREDAVVFSSGYSSNVGVMMSMLGEKDLAILDVYSHASLVDGASLARAHVKYFRHNDINHLRQVLKDNRSRFGGALICVDGVFSMDGDLCPLPALAELAREYGCRLLIDEAHAIGTVGKEGRGTEEYFGLIGAADIITGTLSKAPASVGGYVAASREVCEFVRHLGNSYVFSTALPPATAAGLIEAFRIMRNDDERRTRLRENHELFASLCRSAGFVLAPTKTPIVPVILGDEVLAREFAYELHQAGVIVSPVSFPAVAKNEARLRFGIMASHTRSDIEYVFQHLVRIGKKRHVI
jgi:glycine C-acetyltransferase